MILGCLAQYFNSMNGRIQWHKQITWLFLYCIAKIRCRILAPLFLPSKKCLTVWPFKVIANNKLVKILERTGRMFDSTVISICTKNFMTIGCILSEYECNIPFLIQFIIWEFCKRLRLHNTLTDDGSTNHISYWLLSYPIMQVESFADIPNDSLYEHSLL